MITPQLVTISLADSCAGCSRQYVEIAAAGTPCLETCTARHEPPDPIRGRGDDLPDRDRDRNRPRPSQVHPDRPTGRRHHRRPGRFSPDHQQQLYTDLVGEITATRHLNPIRHSSNPRVVERARHNSFPVKRKTDKGTRHTEPAVIHLANQSYINPTPSPKTAKQLFIASADTN